eukprot:PhF_6_TR31429/c0_g1_i1/m.46096
MQYPGVVVAARVRPRSHAERFDVVCFNKTDSLDSLSIQLPPEATVSSPHPPVVNYVDCVFDETDDQSELYSILLEDHVERCIRNVSTLCLLAYGQTGSGKTFSIFGKSTPGAVLSQQTGVLGRSAADIFAMKNGEGGSGAAPLEVRMTVVEIYNNAAFDLLNDKRSVTFREDSSTGKGFFENITRVPVASLQEVLQICCRIEALRTTKATALNSSSSRSHAIVTLDISNGSRLVFVDLAGSERVKRSEVEDDALKEAININSSLSALGNVVRAMGAGASHVPYRESYLTRVLHNTFAALNSRVVLLVNLAPCFQDYTESEESLKFASRMKEIKMTPASRTASTESMCMLEEYQWLSRRKDIELLGADIRIAQQSCGYSLGSYKKVKSGEITVEKLRKSSYDLTNEYAAMVKEFTVRARTPKGNESVSPEVSLLQHDIRAIESSQTEITASFKKMEIDSKSFEDELQTACQETEDLLEKVKYLRELRWNVICSDLMKSHTETAGHLLQISEAQIKNSQHESLIKQVENDIREEEEPWKVIPRPMLLDCWYVPLYPGTTVGPQGPSDDEEDEHHSIAAIPTSPTSPTTTPGYSIEGLPRGSVFIFNARTTWGDKHYIGLTGFDIFDHTGSLIRLDDPCSQVQGNPHSINVLKEYNNDPRTADKTMNGINYTADGPNMWLAPYTRGSQHNVVIQLNRDISISAIRIWNYNKGKDGLKRGARHAEIHLDRTTIFSGEVLHGSGELRCAEKNATLVPFTMNFDLLRKIKRTICVPPLREPPYASSITFLFHTTHGDIHYLGLNGIEIFDIHSQKITTAVTEKDIEAKPRWVGILPDCKGDVRVVENLFREPHNVKADKHIWLAPYAGSKRQQGGGTATSNLVKVSFPSAVPIGFIRLWNYAKTPTRGVKDFALYVDDDTLVFTGAMKPAVASGVVEHQSVVFSRSPEIRMSEGAYAVSPY